MKASSAEAPICSNAFRIIIMMCAVIHVTFRTLSAVIRLALQISAATITIASLRWAGSSADITELAARLKTRASSCLSK
jgi:hypothetical protein